MIWCLMSWLGNLGFSGRAKKMDYEFEDICPHGPDRRKVPVGNTEHDYHDEQRCVLGFLNAEIVAVLAVFIWRSFCSCHSPHLQYASRWNWTCYLLPFSTPSNLNQACRVPYTGFHLSRCLLLHTGFFLPPSDSSGSIPTSNSRIFPWQLVSIIEGRRNGHLLSFIPLIPPIYIDERLSSLYTTSRACQTIFLCCLVHLPGDHHRRWRPLILACFLTVIIKLEKTPTISQVQAEATALNRLLRMPTRIFCDVYFDSMYTMALQPFPLCLNHRAHLPLLLKTDFLSISNNI